MKKFVTVLCTVIFCIFLVNPAYAIVEKPKDIYVGDYAEVLSANTEQYIIERNQQLCEKTGAQIVIVTVDFLDGMEIEDYAYRIFNDWGIGDSDKNNGLLLLLSIGDDDYWVMQGKGLEGILSSGTLGDMLYDYLEPDFAKGNYDAGVRKVFDVFLNWYQNYYNVDLDSNGQYDYIPSQETDSGYSSDGDGFFWLIVLIIIIILVISFRRRRKDRKNKNNRNYPPGSGGYQSGPRRSVYIPPTTGRTYGGSTSRNRTSGSSGSFRGGSFGGGSSRSSSTGRSFGGSSGGGFHSGGFGGGGSRGGGAGRR